MPKSAPLGILLAALVFALPPTAHAQGGDDCSAAEQRARVCTPDGGKIQDPVRRPQEEDRCGDVNSGEQCGEGNGRTTEGGSGTGKVSHKGWPRITGILWKVLEARGTHRHEGTEDNDELLGHHGNDTVIGNAGKDVLW